MITISAGAAAATLDPDNGGRLATLTVGGRSLLVAREGDAGPMDWGAFPMVPWAGRVRHGRFAFRGRTFELPLDLPPHAAHGTAYRQAWHVEAAGERDATLGCDLAWELGGRAWQRVTIDATRIVCVLGVAAVTEAMPATIGWHPWFVKPDALDFRPAAMYVRDDEGMPTGDPVAPRPGPWDDCFVNTEPVRLRWGALGATVTSDCDHWVVFDQPVHATCVEPQSGPPDAFNIRPHVLEPGEELVRTMAIEWRATPTGR